MHTLLLVTLVAALLVASVTARKEKASEESGDAPLVTRRPLNLKCENGFLKTLLALRHTIEHYGIDLEDEIGWDYQLHESLGTQLRPTRTLLINSESLAGIYEADQRALAFFPIRVGVYLNEEGETRLVFQDSNHFVATFDVYEAADALEALDRILWKLAESAECTLEGHGVHSTDGSTTYAIIRTDEVEVVEALELRAQGLPGLISQCGYCIDEIVDNDMSGLVADNTSQGFMWVAEDFATEYAIPFALGSYRPEGEILSAESPYFLATIQNDYLTYYLLKAAGQEISAVLPVTMAFHLDPYPVDGASADPDTTICVTTLGTEYYEIAYGCSLPEALCAAQEAFFENIPLLPGDTTACPQVELPFDDFLVDN